MKVSFVILTFNRRDDLLATLGALTQNPAMPGGEWQAIVVDNASTDDTAAAVGAKFPDVTVVRRPSNEGSVARNAGVAVASAPYVVFLDDDSYPLGETIARSIDFLESQPDVALVGGRVLLPDGSEDAAAFPIIVPACAMCVRREAFDRVGGFSQEFFRQAEEYDLIFRLLHAGWRVERFEDLEYRHEKVARSRSSELILTMDLRNNLLLLDRYLPEPWKGWLGLDWTRRYAAILRHAGLENRITDVLAEAQAIILADDGASRRILSEPIIEKIFGFERQRRHIAEWARDGRIRSVVIADYSKSLHSTWRAARLAGLDILSIADNSPAFDGMQYRRIPIELDALALARNSDGVILSTVNPAAIDQRCNQLQMSTDRPVIKLWEGQYLAAR